MQTDADGGAEGGCREAGGTEPPLSRHNPGVLLQEEPGVPSPWGNHIGLAFILGELERGPCIQLDLQEKTEGFWK